VQDRQVSKAGLLTAQQVQGMFAVDRSTIYRMAEDGRLPAVKIGRQWRFPAADIQRLLLLDRPGGPRREAMAEIVSGAGAAIDVAADLLGVMMVVTDMDGRPVTGVANPCGRFAARSDDADSVAACVAEWQALGEDLDFEPRFRGGSLGFECARAYIRSGPALVGMVLAGGVAPAGDDSPDLYHLDDEQRRTVLQALLTVARALSRATTLPPTRSPATGRDR
jgi:excisionase family DNA binding protein